MLPKKYRISKTALTRVSQGGKRFPSDMFTLTILRNEDPVSRFSIRIGTAVHKRAVVRNKVKRLFHESMRSILPTLKNNVDILCSIKQASPTETLGHVTHELQKELKKIL